MAALSSGQKIQKRLVENITLLWTLCETPDQPKESKIRGDCDEGRQLTQDRERQLVDSFAFISAWTDNMLRVMAVCIEEDPDKPGMTICLASNSGDLSHVAQGFSGIARTLEQAALRARSRFNDRQDLFRQIVTLDEPRILSRLRSSHAARTRKTMGKPKLLLSLSKTVHNESIYGSDETTKARITNIRSSSKRLYQRFSDYENARGHDSPISISRDILIDVLIRIYEFDVRGLQTVLEMSPKIDPSLKDYLPRAMSKIGRYYCVSCDLIDAARSSKYTLFRRVSVRAIEKPLLNMAFIADHPVRFDQALKRVDPLAHQHPPDAYDSQYASAARTKFQSRMSNCTTPWKVHAEIQLLLFYEQQPHKFRPRIISSSKSACYLCDLFIQLHGEFHIPRTHGRLYDRWILPERPINELSANRHLLSVIDKFNKALEAKIIHTLSRKPPPLPHPDESVLLLREPWSSNSTLSRTHKQDSFQETADNTRNRSSRDHTESLSNTSPCSLSTQSTPTERVRLGAHPCVEMMQPDIHLMKPIEVVHRLCRGGSICCKLTSPRDTLVVQAGSVRVHASWDSNFIDTTCDPFASCRACWVHIQWLACTNQTTHDDTSFESVDIGSLARDHDTVVEGGAALSSKALALQITGHTLLVRYTFKDPANARGDEQ